MIYFIKASDRVKIGYASDPSLRIPAIQTSSPFELEVLLIIDGTYEKERELHSLFQEFRVSGEWFSFEDPIKEFISSCGFLDRKYEFGFDSSEFQGNEQITQLRRRYKMSMEELGAKMNMSKQGVYFLQQSEKDEGISIKSMKKIAKCLGYVFEYRFVKIKDIEEK